MGSLSLYKLRMCLASGCQGLVGRCRAISSRCIIIIGQEEPLKWRRQQRSLHLPSPSDLPAFRSKVNRSLASGYKRVLVVTYFCKVAEGDVEVFE